MKKLAKLGLAVMSATIIGTYTVSQSVTQAEAGEDTQTSLTIENCNMLENSQFVTSKNDFDSVIKATEKVTILSTEEFNTKISKKIDELSYLSNDEKQSYKDKVNSVSTENEVNSIYNEATTKNNENKAVKEQEEQKRKEEEEKSKQAATSNTTTTTTSSSSTNMSTQEAFNKIATEKGLSETDKTQWGYIINHESGWDYTATNASSGAYGLGQALPASKMSSYGADYLTNPYTQLSWMYDYMVNRYGSIAGAYGFWQANNWY